MRKMHTRMYLANMSKNRKEQTMEEQRGDDLIRRADAIQALVDCEDIKYFAYTSLEEALNAIPKIDVAYICNRLRCETCHDYCELTRDINYAADTSKAVVIDARCSGSSEKPNNSERSEFVKVSDRECPWCKAVCASTDKYCHECGWHIADTPQTDLLVKTPQKSRDSHEIDTPQTTMCRECDDYAGDGMYCASNFLVNDFSTSAENCGVERRK